MTGLNSYRIVIAALGLVSIAAVITPVLGPINAEEALDRKSWQAVAPGRVEPWSGEIKIGSTVMGRVGDVLVKINDTVFAGEALVRVDDEDVRNRHAKAELQYNLRKRARPTATARTAARRKLEDAVDEAERAVVEQRAAVDRAAAAKRAGSSSDADLTAARKKLSDARAQLRERRADLTKYEADASSPAPTDAESEFAMARLDLRGAEAALDNLIVRAPINATILQVNIRPGELASPSASHPLIVIGDLSKLRVRAEVDERDYGEIKIGQNVVVRSPAFRGRDVAGTVSSVAPTIEAGRIGARGGRSPSDVNVVEVMIDLAERGPLAVGMKVDVYFSRDGAK